jgi:aminopeptidase YwaD
LADETWEFLVKLTEDFSPRETATDEEKAAADYLLGLFEDIGYEAQLQPFTFERLSTEGPLLTLTVPEERDVEALPIGLGAVATATGLLVDVGLARVDDLPESGLSGKIALVRRGLIAFEDKVRRVQDAGAVAAIIYNNLPNLFRGTLRRQAGIPAVSISKENGESIMKLMAGGDVEATVAVTLTIYDSRNVVAEKPGTAGDGSVVVLGAHYDTVPNTQGANDNGSGVTVLMTIAREVADTSYPFALRFIAFGSEEVGLFGSRHYVDTLSPDEVAEIVAMLNFDVPGSGEIVQVIGSFDLANKALAYADANDIAVMRGSPLEGAGSDHQPFKNVEIPYLFFLADDLSRINSPADSIEFVKPELMGAAAALGLGLLDALAEEQ